MIGIEQQAVAIKQGAAHGLGGTTAHSGEVPEDIGLHIPQVNGADQSHAALDGPEQIDCARWLQEVIAIFSE